MAVAPICLDTGALIALESALQKQAHPLKQHWLAWTRDDASVYTPAPAWCEYWRGRGSNAHFVAKVKASLRVSPIDQAHAEAAADALRKAYGSDDKATVKHVIDAMVMAYADRMGSVVYTGDTTDLERLWDEFPGIRKLISDGGAVVKTR